LNRTLLLLTVLLIAAALSENLSAAGTTLLQCGSARSFTRAFRGTSGPWKADGQGFTGVSPHYRDLPGTRLGDFADDAHTFFVVHGVNLWRYAPAGDTTWTDYTLTTTVHILDPAPLDGIRPGQNCVFMNYQWGREAMGSDAGLCVRYQGPDCYYQVRLSSGYRHLELWKTKGGVVCVKPFVFTPGKDYRLTVTASGRWITVAVDGTELLRYYDPVAPILSGKVALAVRESRVRFSNLRVDAVPADATAPPPHVANFHLRDWVGRRYIFDGDEPIAHFALTGGYVEEMKLAPGLMPMMINAFGATWGNMHWKEDPTNNRCTVRREGEVLALHLEQDDQDSRCAGSDEWTLTYDPAIGYLWDVHERVEVLVDNKVAKWALDIADPCFYQVLAPATSKMPTCRTAPIAALYTRPDGKFGWFPVNHLITNDGNDLNGTYIRRGGFFATTVDDWAAVVDVPADNAYLYNASYCHWGLDQHVEPVMDPSKPNTFSKANKGDVYSGHVRYYALSPARVKEMLAQGVPVAPADHSEMLAHEEPINHCTDIVPAIAGDSKVRWQGGYTIDHTVGRGDKCSMRIDAAEAKRKGMPLLKEIGPSFRTGPYTGLMYRIGLWVKAEHFTGKVTLKVDKVVFPKPRQFTNPTAAREIHGKCGWTFIGFDTDFPRLAHFWDMLIDVQGDGVIWVDDLEISPLE